MHLAVVGRLAGLRISSEGTAAVFTADSGGKFRVAAIAVVGHVIAHPFTLVVFVFIRPAILLGCGYPFLQGHGAVVEMELQNLTVQHLNGVHSLKENILIELVQSKGRSAGFTKHSLRDVLIAATSAFFLGGAAAPENNLVIVG